MLFYANWRQGFCRAKIPDFANQMVDSTFSSSCVLSLGPKT